MSNDHGENRNGLYFPPEVAWMRTPLRDSALEYIYATALDLAGERVKSASVSISHTGEEDSEAINLTLRIDSDWDFIHKLGREILLQADDWVRQWHKEDWEDYATRVYFSLFPVNP